MQSFPEQDFSHVQLTGRVELSKKADLSMEVSMGLDGTIETFQTARADPSQWMLVPNGK